MSHKCPAADQLLNYKEANPTPPVMTTSNGVPVACKTSVLTVGPRGPMLLQDALFLDEMTHFDRERAPERVVHAKGAGAHGYFEVTHDITKYCKAEVFNTIGKRTPLFVRFSTVGGEMGSPDTVRNPRGFAVKFYTQEGNWDLVGNNTPIFFIRDPILFPSFMHTQKRNPQTNLKDMDAVWDFWSIRTEAIHQIMWLFSDRGTPDGYRHVDGFGSHTFKMVNKDNQPVYCKFHFKTQQGIKNLPAAEAKQLTADEPDYATKDLFVAIENGDFPAWQLEIQVMTFEQAEKCDFNPFDVTKVWPNAHFPRIPVGRMVLNKNPTNYFAEVEQSAFCPAHVVPGIEFSPDRMLQGRLFSYTDTQFHRLGPNKNQLPVNCPYRARPHNSQRAGTATIDCQGAAPNYHPNSFNGPQEQKCMAEPRFHLSGDVGRYDDTDDHNFDQPRVFWDKILDEPAKQRMLDNLFCELKVVKPFIQVRAIEMFSKVHPDFGSRMRKMIDEYNMKNGNGCCPKNNI